MRHLFLTLLLQGAGILFAQTEAPDSTVTSTEIAETDTTHLDEVTVIVDKSELVTRTANGQIFYLSKEARKQRNPFKALQEIPMLISDPSNSTITTIDGNSPLILIDGNRVNTGISPIDPAEIQSVEIITNPSARYIKEGIKTIINIKLKRKENPYVWYELATRHDTPIDNGFGVGYFEIGNPKYSIYGRSSLEYTYHSDITSDTDRNDTDYTQSFREKNRTDSHAWLGEMLFKANPDKNNYFATHAYASVRLTKNYVSGTGEMTTSISSPYEFTSHSRDKSIILTGSAYYKHTFSENNELEARAAYNFNRNRFSNQRNDTFYDINDEIVSAYELFNNRRHTGTLTIDYQNSYSQYSMLSAGAHTSLQFDHIMHKSTPASLFRHHQASQYIYAGWVNKFFGKIWFMGSGGIECIWMKADSYSRHYFRPRVSLGITWQINERNSINLDYQLTNDAPGVEQLNPFNTSTDILVIRKGNPRLRPQYMHFIPLSYTYNIGKLYIRPYLYYKRINRMLSSTGYTDENGIFISTYENHGHFTQLYSVLNLSYRLKNGRIYAGGGWYGNYFHGQTAHSAFTSMAGFSYTAGKFSFYGNMDYSNRSVANISVTRYRQPSSANLQINYNFTPDFYIGACLQHFTGEYNTITVTKTGNYTSVTHTYFTEYNLRPWVILRYTFRKNTNRKINLDKVLNSEEKGIRLK